MCYLTKNSYTGNAAITEFCSKIANALFFFSAKSNSYLLSGLKRVLFLIKIASKLPAKQHSQCQQWVHRWPFAFIAFIFFSQFNGNSLQTGAIWPYYHLETFAAFSHILDSHWVVFVFQFSSTTFLPRFLLLISSSFCSSTFTCFDLVKMLWQHYHLWL